MIGFKKYRKNLIDVLHQDELENGTKKLFKEILYTWKNKKNFFICGNGGSGANAIHIANDFLYGAGTTNKKGLKVGKSISLFLLPRNSNSALLKVIIPDW